MFQLVCFNKLPLVVTILADRKANTGELSTLSCSLRDLHDGSTGNEAVDCIGPSFFTH